MPDLIAQGPRPDQRWRRVLPDSATREFVTVGRTMADWNAPWDKQISRCHVRVTPLDDDRISIEVVEAASNPVFYHGHPVRRATLVPGEHFVIGETTFTLLRHPAAHVSSDHLTSPVDEQTFDVSAVRRENFHDAAGRMDVLTRLPDLISGSHSQDELLVRLTGVLMQAIPDSVTVAFVRLADATADQVDVLYGDVRPTSNDIPVKLRVGDTNDLQISVRLVNRAASSSMAVLHRWNRSIDVNTQTQFTAVEQIDWAMAIPIRPDDACAGWVLYVSGTEPGGLYNTSAVESQKHLDRRRRDDVKFVELIAGTIGNLLHSRRLQKRQTAMRQFFSPVVLSALADENADRVLMPKSADLSVLFCDLRGFSEASLRLNGDLLGLLSQVSQALSVMTGHILDCDGVIGDFHGDSAMGFWGWPIAQPNSAAAALRAAIQIRDSFKNENIGFKCGIGIASGPGVAGGIGSDDQIKVTAFGPVVNLASRLESLTKTLGAEIIVDSATRNQVEAALGDSAQPKLGLPAGVFQSLGPVSIKGWQSPETVFQWVSDILK
jgi:adenylate cyclase